MNTPVDNQSYIVEVTAQNVQQMVLDASSKVPVLLDVWAEWCEPCKALTPILEKLAEQYAGRFILAKLNADEQQELTAQLGVQSLPTLKLIVGGQIGGELSGQQPESVIRELLDKFVEEEGATEPSDNLAEEIRRAINARDTDSAQQLLQLALTEHPEDKSYQYLAIELLVSAGELAAAKQRFEDLAQEDKDAEGGKRVEAGFYFADILEAASHETDYVLLLENNPGDADALFYGTATMAATARYDEALKLAWHLFQTHMSYKSGEPKVVLLKVFDLLGKSDARAQKYRRKMFNFLH